MLLSLFMGGITTPPHSASGVCFSWRAAENGLLMLNDLLPVVERGCKSSKTGGNYDWKAAFLLNLTLGGCQPPLFVTQGGLER